MANLIDKVDAAQLRDDVPDFRPGDTLDVNVKVIEGKTQRVQLFKGVCIRRQGAGIRETFTVRKVSFGIGVERTFPVHSRTSSPSRLYAAAASAVQSCTTCATCAARRLASRSAANFRRSGLLLRFGEREAFSYVLSLRLQGIR